MPDPAQPAPATAPAGKKMVRLSIDGLEVEAPPGLNLIETARKVGVQIPCYCYHARLSVAASCRMCLVEVSTAAKLMPACQVGAADNLVVKTNTPRVREQQAATIELLLLNHPVDCPICDQAGECGLQDYYERYDLKPSRLSGAKILKNKRKVLGPLVVLDQERCIMCTRCVRFMGEIAKQPQLGLFGRGSHERIDVFPQRPLDSKYSGNVVDICPVGAMLSRDFRFKARAFFLSKTPSVCTGCERGCSIWLDHFDGTVCRYRPRENPQVNDVWMCDDGRLSYKYLSLERLLTARAGRGPKATPANAGEAVAEAVSILKPRAGQPSLAVLASPLASVEDLLVSLAFARDALHVTKVYVGGRVRGDGDDFLVRPGKNPNYLGLEWIAKAFGLSLEPYEDLFEAIGREEVNTVYAIGAEVPDDARRAASAFATLDAFVLQAFNDGPLTNEAHVALPASPHAEDHGTFVNFEGRVQRFARAYLPKGESRPHWRWATDLAAVFGMGARHSDAREVFAALAPRVPELASFAWDSLPQELLHRGTCALPAAADGRPPNYRESG